MILETEGSFWQMPKGDKIEVGEKLFMVGVITSNAKWLEGTGSGCIGKVSLPKSVRLEDMLPVEKRRIALREIMEQLSEI